MLMRYATNLAAGHGIRWNPSEPPVDGATDFGFMVLVAALMKLGMSAETAVLTLTVGSHLLTIVVVCLATNRYRTPWGSVAAAALVAFGPGLFYARVYFGTPLFGLAVALTWASALHAAGRPSDRLFNIFASCGLSMSLIRPEGAILFAVMASGLALQLGSSDRHRLVRAGIVWYLPVASAYFAFHWAYFRYPLPNPFYKKGGGHIFPAGLSDSLRLLRMSLLPAIPLYFFALRRTGKLSALYVGPIACFSVVWLLLSNETNYLLRFQYPILIMIAISVPALVSLIRDRCTEARHRQLLNVIAVLCAAVLLLGTFNGQVKVLRTNLGRDSRAVVGQNLAMIPGRHTLATTEAGLLPFYSGWDTLDLWGLNNTEIAHHGLDRDVIDRANPDLFLIHWVPATALREWHHMAETARAWAIAHNFILAASYGPPDDEHLYFVKPGPDAARLVAAVRIPSYDRRGP